MKSLSIFLTIGVFVIFNTNAQTAYEKQIRDITTELSKKVAETGKKRIAVADFTDTDGTATKLGKFIAEEFNTYLPEAGQNFEVIDRSRINVLIKENQMLRKGLTDPTAAAQLGKLAGIDALIYGTLTAFGESVRVNIKILDIQRGVILRSLIGNITRTADINKLLSEIIENNDQIEVDSGEKKTTILLKPSANCKEKNTCVICVTNKQNQAIEANGGFFLGESNGPKLIHPETTKCWQDVRVGGSEEEFRFFQLNISRNRYHIKSEDIRIEACQVYSYEFKN